MRKYKWFILTAIVLLLGWRLGVRYLSHSIPDATSAQIERSKKVRILRDEFGVPHIFAKSNGDVAFGLAYAHAEDDFPTIEKVLAATRGQLALYELSKEGVENDFYVKLFRPDEVAARNYYPPNYKK
jgi:acyl-homoserine lactone acylase PvdQ